MQHRELERLSGEREGADAREHGERHRADLEDDEQDRDAQVLDALIHQPHQRVEPGQHAGAGKARLVVQRVLDLLELSGDRAHLGERARPRGRGRGPTRTPWSARAWSPSDSAVSRDTSSGCTWVESGGGNGLRDPNQNGSRGSGGRNVPLTVSSVASPAGPTSVTRSPICTPRRLRCVLRERDLARPGRLALERQVILGAVAEEERHGGAVGSVQPDRGQALTHDPSPTGSDRVSDVIDASASAYGKSPLPNAWIRDVRDGDGGALDGRGQDRRPRRVGVDRAGDEDPDAERERDHDREAQQPLSREPLEEEPERRHGVVGRRRHERCAYPPAARPMIRTAPRSEVGRLAEPCPARHARRRSLRAARTRLLGWPFEPRNRRRGAGRDRRGVSAVDRPEIILAPGPTPIPPEVLLAQGSPLVYHRGPGFGKLMREVTDRLRELYRTEDADVLLMTSTGTGGLESAIQNCFSPGDEVFVPLAGFFADRWKRLAEAYGLTRPHRRLRVGDEDPARRRRRGARRAPGQGGAAHAERDLDRRDPAGRGARARGERRGGDGRRRRGLVARRGAVRLRRLGHRRRGRRLAEGAVRLARHRVRGDQRSRVGGGRDRHEPALLLRLGDLPAVRGAARPREPVDAGDQRDAGTARRARAVLPGRGRRRAARGTGRCRAP